MSQKILTINFKYHVTKKEFEQMSTHASHAIADVPGCQWKIWVVNDEQKEAGGVYLFNDEESMKNYKSGPIIAAILSNPAFSDFDLKEQDILKEQSEITHAPLSEVSIT